MPRTNEDGARLQAVLGYVLDRPVSSTEIYRALGIARNTYATRSLQDDFPNAEELRLVGAHFGLNSVKLMVSFALVSPQEIEECLGDHPFIPAGGRPANGPLAMRMASAPARTMKIAELSRRADHPPV